MPTSTEPLVVLGIVLDGHGRVLLVRRRWEERWIFPGGQSEPGEQEAETVAREVLEESGVRCKAASFIGRRTHPESGREIAYWLCQPLSEQIAVGDAEEIAEARWISIKESLTLLGSRIYEPVRNLLISSF